MNIFKRVLASIIPKNLNQTLWSRAKMEKAFVRCVDGEENMKICFSYRDKNSSLLRPQAEALEKSLARIQCTMKKHVDKEMKKRKKMKLDRPVDTGGGELSVSLSRDNCCIDSSTDNHTAWDDGSVLKIGESSYHVCRNFPTILRLDLPSFVLVGCPVFPRLSVEFSDTETFAYKWLRQNKPGNLALHESKQEAGATSDGICGTNTLSASSSEEWVVVGNEKTYTPTTSDVGSNLKLVCTPKNGTKVGEEKEGVTMRAVKNGPEVYPFEKRHAFTKERTSLDCFRVFSYNILADLYADSDYSRDVLFPYCPAVSLDIDYREQLLLKEIAGYNADILCLQECGKKLFEHCLQPALGDLGFQGLLFCKARETPEGEGLFFRKDRFRLLEQFDISLAQAFEEEPSNKDLLEVVSKSPAMLNQVITRTSVLQVAVLEDVNSPGQMLCVANTHLYFHPRAGHVRLIQTMVILRHLRAIKEQYAQKHPGSKLALMLCGDLNSSPVHPGVYELISKKHIPPNHVQWYASGKEEFCGGMTLTHDLEFTNACTSQTYTNYVAGFMASLDYVLIDGGHLEVTREIPMPDHEDVIKYVALPNEVFPSDHLAIGCEVRWKDP